MVDNFWADQSVIVAGGAGFLGAYVVEKLRERGARSIYIVRSKDYDLRHEANVRRLLADVKATMIIHLAAVVGGIGANREHPGSFFYDNMIMGVTLMEQARLAGIAKFVAICTICAYPKFTAGPFPQGRILDSLPPKNNTTS